MECCKRSARMRNRWDQPTEYLKRKSREEESQVETVSDPNKIISWIEKFKTDRLFKDLAFIPLSDIQTLFYILTNLTIF